MRSLGYVLIAIGLAFLCYFLFVFLQRNDTLHSPIPEQQGVKVIYITPGE